MKNSGVIVLVVLLMVGARSWGMNGDMGQGTDPEVIGSEIHPFLIEDMADFEVFSDPCRAGVFWAEGVHVRLMCDLDLEGAGDHVDGTYSSAVIAPDSPDRDESIDDDIFTGVGYDGLFDGMGHRIEHVMIQADGTNYCGLFGLVGAPAVVRNVVVDDVIVDGWRAYYGGICGKNEGLIEDCVCRSAVLGDGDECRKTGGICGWNQGAIVTCSAGCEVLAEIHAGGICGYNDGGDILRCYADVDIRVEDDGAGGICGRTNGGMIRNCYAKGELYAYETGGGICGVTDESALIENCYTMVEVSGDEALGCVCGYLYHEGSVIRNCFFDVDMSGQIEACAISIDHPGTIENVVGMTTEQMKKVDIYANAGWDFVDVWGIGQGQTYPYLRVSSSADVNGDGVVDLDDLSVLGGHWLEGAN